MLFSILITSCGNAPSSASDTKEDNVSQDNFQGEYVANDSSTLTITENSGKYEIVINIVRLTNIDDGIGEVSTSTSELKFTATDAQGNSIEGKISLVNKDLAVLEFTKSTWEYLPNGTKIEFTRKSVVTESTEGTEYSEEYLYNSQMILFNYDMLDLSISGYQNKIGERYFMHFSEQERLDPYYIKLHDKVKYYYAQEKLVGIDENNEVCLFSCAASKIVGEYAPPVRDVISALGITDMFEIQPDVTVVHNQNNSRNFFYWKISNGYIGFVTIGGNDPSQCYN
ncbi:MAG: hypothetical protein IIU65_03560, partial [Clostridia bacterium]|nr:hypothetical protein [Clostridia bacterium]